MQKMKCDWLLHREMVHLTVMFCDHIAIVVTTNLMFRHIVSGSWNNQTWTVYRALETCFSGQLIVAVHFSMNIEFHFLRFHWQIKNVANKSTLSGSCSQSTSCSLANWRKNPRYRTNIPETFGRDWITGLGAEKGRRTDQPTILNIFSHLQPNAVGITSLPLFWYNLINFQIILCPRKM